MDVDSLFGLVITSGCAGGSVGCCVADDDDGPTMTLCDMALRLRSNTSLPSTVDMVLAPGDDSRFISFNSCSADANISSMGLPSRTPSVPSCCCANEAESDEDLSREEKEVGVFIRLFAGDGAAELDGLGATMCADPSRIRGMVLSRLKLRWFLLDRPFLRRDDGLREALPLLSSSRVGLFLLLALRQVSTLFLLDLRHVSTSIGPWVRTSELRELVVEPSVESMLPGLLHTSVPSTFSSLPLLKNLRRRLSRIFFVLAIVYYILCVSI